MIVKIALDADGVLFDFQTSWRLCAEGVLGRALPLCGQHYDLGQRYGLKNAEVHKVWAVWNTTSGWLRAQPIESGMRAAHMALDLGHEVYVVTCLPNIRAAEERRRALDRWGLDKAALIPVYGASKLNALKTLRPHFYADDRAIHCREARDAMVPEIVRIHAWGPEQLPDGVCEYPDVGTALSDFLKRHAPLHVGPCNGNPYPGRASASGWPQLQATRETEGDV